MIVVSIRSVEEMKILILMDEMLNIIGLLYFI